MEKTGQNQKHYGERSEFYILFLTGVYNLIFVDISLAGMPIRTLLLLMADFFCIAVYLYKGEMILPRWKERSVYERVMTVLLIVAAVMLAGSALTDSKYFWTGVDIAALLMIYPCICGRKKFPQDIFCVYSACSCVICILILCYYLAGGICEPFIALLLQDNAVVPWLVLSITMNMIAYCFQEKGQKWYGGNILLTAFLLAIQKNIYGMAIVGIVPLLIPVFCRPSKVLAERAAQIELMYLFLLCNMSLITGYTPLLEGIVTYDLEVSVYMELLLAAMGVWFFGYWDKYAQDTDADTTLPQMRVWYRKAAMAYLVSIAGILAASELFCADDASTWKDVAQVILNGVKDNPGWKAGLLGRMGQSFGAAGIGIACVLFYLCIVRIDQTRRWRVKAHRLYRLITVVCLLQAVFLPQTMASLPVYIMFFFLFMEAEEKPSQKITSDYGERGKTNETDYTDSMLQRGGDAGDCIE